MTRRTVLFVMLISSVLAFALACGGSSGTTTPTGTTSGITSGTTTPTPPLAGTFTKITPSGPVSTIIGNVQTITWNAAGYALNLVLRVGITNNASATDALTWFPATYANGTNSIDWNTTGYLPGVYYILFKFEVSGAFNYFYSPPVTLTSQAPYTSPPTLQLMAPINSKTIYPNADVPVSFKVGNADAGVVSQIGVDDDENFANGVFAWLPTTYPGTGIHNATWSTASFPNGTFYVVVKATNNGLSTYAYSQYVRIADFIDFGDPPIVEFQTPTSAVLVPAGTSVSIRFSLDDPDSSATARFILDNDSNPDNGWLSVVYDNVIEGVRSYDWTTLGISPGIYYFLVLATDGVNNTTKYSPAVVVNPAVGLTDPPVITITAPSRALILPVGAPLDIAGTVVDSDSEAIVQIGIDNDDNFANGVTGWIASTFTGSFAATWTTTYYPAGVYRVIVLARDGINEIYKYTDTIDLKFLMPSGFNSSKLAVCYNSTIYDAIDQIGAYRAIHPGSTSTAGIFHTTNGDGTWSTSNVVPSSVIPYPVSAGFDSLNELHFDYIYRSYSSRYVNNRRLSTGNAVRVSYSNYPNCEPLDLIPADDGNDISLTTSYNGTNLRMIVARRTGDNVDRMTVISAGDTINNYNNNRGMMYFNPDGTGYVVARISNNDGASLTYPVYYVYYNGSTWGTPQLIATQLTDAYAIKAMYHNNSVHVMAQHANNITYAVCLGQNFSTQNVIPDPEVGQLPVIVTWADMHMFNDTIQVAWRETTNLNISTLAGSTWTLENLGSAKSDAAIFWLSTPTTNYLFTSTGTIFGAFRSSILGWSFEPIRNAAEGFLPYAAYTGVGDIVVAFRTTTNNEKRLNFARRAAGSNEWLNNDLANDCSTFGTIRLIVNSANNIYIRYFDTNLYLTVVTFR